MSQGFTQSSGTLILMSVCNSSYNTRDFDQQLVVWSASADCCICITQQCALGMLQERHELSVLTMLRALSDILSNSSMQQIP